MSSLAAKKNQYKGLVHVKFGVNTNHRLDFNLEFDLAIFVVFQACMPADK